MMYFSIGVVKVREYVHGLHFRTDGAYIILVFHNLTGGPN